MSNSGNLNLFIYFKNISNFDLLRTNLVVMQVWCLMFRSLVSLERFY